MPSFNRKRGVLRFSDTGTGGGVTDPFKDDVTYCAVYQGENGTGGGIVDMTGRHARTLTGSPTTVSATKEFGISSMQLTAASSQGYGVSNSSDFHTTANGFTVDGIVRRDGVPTAGNVRIIVRMADTTATTPFAVNIINAGEFGVILSESTSGDISSGLTGRGAIADTTFTHFALVHDPGVEYRFYIDGALSETISSTTAFADGDGQLQVGRFDSANYWNGHIQALRITQNVRYTGSSYTVPGYADYIASFV